MTQTTPSAAGPPTVVLLHGAFADAASWNGVIERLQAVTDVILSAVAAVS